MIEQDTIRRAFRVDVERIEDRYRVEYWSRGLQQELTAGGKPKKVSPYIAYLKPDRSAQVAWDEPPTKVEQDLVQFEADARQRVLALDSWLHTLDRLIKQLTEWLDDLGWSHRLIEKPLDDSEIGTHKVPALLLQDGATRMLVEPIARRAPRAQGVVDLYRMPAYEDIATFYFDGRKWQVRYAEPTESFGRDAGEAETKPLSKATLRSVLETMKCHAG
jgi:hypothetical protein